ncbi:N,N-dimethylformamidase [Streptomyces sp. AJS327]|uniref:N,N-dimethylformamidase beta subunit family domain-containing protein n=1 Tax=Streptomyces sp. AJS327 TaxID=2545265 RepID=UPI0015DF1339|nr:N,N-dimethylformamidase beta subunit family domain-containing protein [Streptomyces sp. AJS327]MBA0050082.1 N,N-dimethylformamidase [Streptomyces sp. AJS327]
MRKSDGDYLRLNSGGDILGITGYADRWGVRAGEAIAFHVSTVRAEYRADVVELLGGMTDPGATDLPVRPVPADCAGTHPGYVQLTDPGSYGELPLPADWLGGGACTVQLRFSPTLPEAGHEQVLFSSGDAEGRHLVKLAVDEAGRLGLTVRAGDTEASVTSGVELRTGCWFFVSASHDPDGGWLRLDVAQETGWQRAVQRDTAEAPATTDLAGARLGETYLAATPVWIDGARYLDHHFNGKIENPRCYARVLDADEVALALGGGAVRPAALVCDYDLGADFATTRLRDVSGNNRHGVLRQAPQRAVTSSRWDGRATDFAVAPEQYAAVHFHEDDLEDAAWATSLTWDVPPDTPPGAYALRLRIAGADGAGAEEVDYIPFFVRRPVGSAPAPVLFLVPSFTYQAYANERLFESGLQEDFMIHSMRLAPQDEFIVRHDEVGKSLYDTHTDGSGVAYSSRLRPVLNLRPHYHNWLSGHVRHLAADLFILGWLRSLAAADSAYDVDVVLDEDLHREGPRLLAGHRVVVTGSHPEYWSRDMMDSLSGYLGDGGRLMYLGGNGFYWVTSAFEDRPHLVEVRRGNSGTRCWDSPPGELHHSATGDHGGLWRFNGYVPQRLVGVGMASQGWGQAAGYRRLPDSHDERAAFVFEGLDPDEVIGDFGHVLGGAAGDEVDRFGFDLGTPAHALRLATSLELDDRYQITQEELLMTAPGQGGTENELVRSDLTYFEIDGGGAVFSVGSICWAGSLAWNGYDNNVARVTGNVLARFVAE